MALAAGLSLTACSGSSGGPSSTPNTAGARGSSSSTGTAGATGSTGPSATSTVATRWWSNSAAGIGSTIDPADPTAAAGKLQPDRNQYCSMLKQTMAAGKSILPGAGASDPRLLTSTEAFLTELQHVAPAEVSSQWKTLGGALIEFVKTTGKSTGGVSTAAINSAAQAISADATAKCHVNIAASGS